VFSQQKETRERGPSCQPHYPNALQLHRTQTHRRAPPAAPAKPALLQARAARRPPPALALVLLVVLVVLVVLVLVLVAAPEAVAAALRHECEPVVGEAEDPDDRLQRPDQLAARAERGAAVAAERGGGGAGR
jgi:hypothetical protein